MKIKLLCSIAALTLATVVALNVNFNKNNLSDISLANVEALADNGTNGSLGGGCGWEGATVTPCLINWSGTCVGSCDTFFNGHCARSAYYSWCHE